MIDSEALASITVASIWMAVFAWAATVAGLMLGRTGSGVRWIWTAGAGAFLVHAVAAFAAFYENSHAMAIAETARQTAELTGIETGFGLWLNYLFGAVWLADVVRGWVTGSPPLSSGNPRMLWGLHGFFAFMIFNGTVVFGQGAVRWFGIAVFASLAAIALRARVQSEN